MGGRVVTRALCVALLALIVGCGPKERTGLDRVRATGVLRWGGDVQGGEPYVWQDAEHGDRLVGFEVDLANAIAREMGVRAQFVQNDWSNLVPSLERGAFDVAMNGLEVTPARAARVRFTRPYYVFGARLMARRDDRSITPNLSSLRGRRVGTLANSFSFDLVRDVADVRPYEGVEEPYIDLEQGRTDAVLLDDIIAARYGETKPALRVVGDLADGYYSIAVRREDRALHDAVDAALARVVASGELERILRGANLWNARQAPVSRWSDDDQRRMLGQVGVDRGLSRGHVGLFARAAWRTLWISSLAMMVAMALGMLLAVARMYGPALPRRLADAFVEIYRGTPVLLQLFVLYYGLAPVLKLSAPVTAVVGLGMNYAAYEAEVYRAGIQAVPKGQMEAALSLGMSTPLALRRVVLPQAFRAALPSVTNDFIALLKDSSLVSVISVVELTKQMSITAVDTRSWLVPGAICAAMYFAMSYPLSILARRLEARLARS